MFDTFRKSIEKHQDFKPVKYKIETSMVSPETMEEF